jgi:hypothetical protein
VTASHLRGRPSTRQRDRLLDDVEEVVGAGVAERYFLTEPYAFSRARSVSALSTVAWIFERFRTMRVSAASRSTSFGEKEATSRHRSRGTPLGTPPTSRR